LGYSNSHEKALFNRGFFIPHLKAMKTYLTSYARSINAEPIENDQMFDHLFVSEKDKEGQLFRVLRKIKNTRDDQQIYNPANKNSLPVEASASTNYS